MNHPSTCLPRESGIQGCRSPTLGIRPPSSTTHPSAHQPPHTIILSHQLTTVVVWDLPKADGVALRIRRHAPYLEASKRETKGRQNERRWSNESDKKREMEREGGGKEGSYADIEAALESLNVIRLKGF